MLFHSCPTCEPSRITRRSLLAGLGAVGAAAVLPSLAARSQATPKLIDTHHHFYPPAYLKRQMEWESARKIPPFPGVPDWTPVRAIEQMDKRARRSSTNRVTSAKGSRCALRT